MVALAARILGGIISSLVWLLVRHFWVTSGSGIDGDGPIRVRRLTLVDDAGRERALLRLLDGNVMLLLTDEAMSWRIRLSAGDRGPFLRFIERQVNTRLGIGILQDGPPGLELADADGTPRASLRIDAAGGTSLTLRDKKGLVRGSFAVPAEGNPSLVLSDHNGNTLAKLP
jgi:hypothetical protein